jgi:hypothetical protein
MQVEEVLHATAHTRVHTHTQTGTDRQTHKQAQTDRHTGTQRQTHTHTWRCGGVLSMYSVRMTWAETVVSRTVRCTTCWPAAAAFAAILDGRACGAACLRRGPGRGTGLAKVRTGGGISSSVSLDGCHSPRTSSHERGRA